MKDYYGILQVNSNASNEIIEKAYKTLVKKYHPDLYSSVQKKEAERKMKDINEAYNILSDSFLRAQYDLELQREKENARIHEFNRQNNVQNNREVNHKGQKGTQNRRKKPQNEYVRKKSNVGTIFGIVDLVKDIWANKPEKKERKRMNQTDWLAIGLTILALIIIGIVLWFIPFTNGWMRQLLFENPIFNFIGGLFS